MHIQSDRALIPAGAPSTRYLSVTISAPAAAPPTAGESARAKRPGVDVSLVLDRSGSMGGRKISLAREAVAHAIRLLNDNDQLSVVVYDSEVDTVLERTAATKQAKQRALATLAQIDARGSTDLAEGWYTGARSLGATGAPGGEPRPGDLPLSFEKGAVPSGDAGQGGAAGARGVAASAAGSDRVTRVLLLTDGLANQGVTEPEALRKAAARYRSQGINTSTFGLGADFDEELLTSMASEGGGHFYFIEQARQIPDLLASELGEVLDVVARDVVFEVAAGENTSVLVLNGLPVEQAGDVTRVRLGDLVTEQDVTLILAVTCAARTEGTRAWVDCRVSDRGGVLFAGPMRVEWTAVPVAQDRQQPVNHVVLLEAARMLAEGARAQALGANRKGDYEHASRALDAAARQIGQLGIDDDIVQEIVRQLLGEKHVFASHMDAMEQKARHFVSYSISHSREAGKARKRGDK